MQEISRAEGVDLNTASPERLASLCSLGSDRAQRLVSARPLESWDDVCRLEGFSHELLLELQRAGARIGGAGGGGDRPGRAHA